MNMQAPLNPFPSRSQSRREWLTTSLCLAGVLASWQGLAASGSPRLRSWKRRIPLGKSGLKVTPLGFGCEDAKDPKLVRQAADLGINHFNCFPNRGDISRFPTVGEALRPVRSRIVLASGSSARTKDQLLADLDRQLLAFGTDQIDLFYLLAVSKPETLKDEMLEALDTARHSGKIRAGALSTHGFAAILPRLLEHTDTIQALMVTCNFAAWDSSGWTEALPDVARLRKAGVGIVAMKSLMGGMGETPQGRSALAEALKSPTGRTQVMSAALRWILQNRLVDTVPLLIKNEEELQGSLRAASGEFTTEDQQLLGAAVVQARPNLCRLCPSCSVTCPAGLPVPELMRMMMYARGYDDLPRARAAYADLEDSIQRVRCEKCPECTAHCPQGVAVRDLMLTAQTHLTQPRFATPV